MADPARSTQDTRQRLILTAERLFAERGIGEVSLREVGAAAGQRNTSAAQYHFGDKAALIEAILEHRMRTVNEHRLRHLATMRTEKREHELRSLLEALVVPLAGSTGETGSHYGRFLSRLFADPHRRASLERDSATGLRLVREGIRGCLSDLPEQVVRARLRMLEHLVLHTIADHEHTGDSSEVERPAPWTIELVEAAAGMLTAPAGTGRAGPRP